MKGPARERSRKMKHKWVKIENFTGPQQPGVGLQVKTAYGIISRSASRSRNIVATAVKICKEEELRGYIDENGKFVEVE